MFTISNAIKTEDGEKNEVADISDMDGFSANDENKEGENKPKKRRRRKREIDMIRIDDDGSNDEDSSTEDGLKKLTKLSSPGPYSPGHSGIREPRQCVLKASQKRKPLSRLLEQLLRNLEKKDPNQFFAWPVNDNFAPNYSNVIKRPMDFSTIKQKIDDNGYRSLNCFIADFKLMCNNAMKYNKNGTVYHKAAKRLLHQGLKQLTPAKLRPLGHILTYMYEIPIRELGFDIGKMDVKVLKNNSPVKNEESEQQSDSAGESKPEQNSAEDELKLQMEAEREQHRKRLARKAFPRMDADGKSSLCLLLGHSDAGLPLHERTPPLGQYIGRLAHGSGSLQTFREDRRNLVSGVKPLDYGPFSSYAPAYDSTFASLTKEESHLLYHTLGAETGAGNEELLRFEPDSPWAAIYDMEEMFPVYKKPDDITTTAEDDLSKVKVDVEQLRGLGELGVDVEFLTDLEEEIEASQRDYGLSNALQHTLKILQRLESEQRERLSGPLPPHLSLVPRAGGAERELARAAVSCLRGMLSRVSPRHVAPLPALRSAMGVTLHHLDTPLLLDDFNDATLDQIQEKNQNRMELNELMKEEIVVKMEVEENIATTPTRKPSE